MTPTMKKLVFAVAVLVVATVAAVIVVSRDDGATDFSDPQQLIERLEAAGIEGCRSEERMVACFDAAGVAYFQGILLEDDGMASPDVIAEACDPSTIVAVFTEGQNWFGRVRAHSQRAPDLAAALGSTALPCS